MPFTRIGYGQVEPNQLSGIKTGQIFASLPLDDRTIAGGASADTKVDLLQNGEFMFYDYVTGYVSGTNGASVDAEPYLVYNEIKIYEDWLSYKDFAMIRVGDNLYEKSYLSDVSLTLHLRSVVIGNGCCEQVHTDPNAK